MGDSKDDWLHLEGRYTNLLYPILGSSWNLGRGRLCFSIYENYQINELRTMAMHVRRASPRGPGGQYTANEVTRLRQHSSFGTIISSPAEHPPVPHEDSLTKHLTADTYSSLSVAPSQLTAARSTIAFSGMQTPQKPLPGAFFNMPAASRRPAKSYSHLSVVLATNLKPSVPFGIWQYDFRANGGAI
jgi:hypothetical protein